MRGSSSSLPAPEKAAMLEKEVLSSQACTVTGTRGSRVKLLQGKFPLDVGKIFFTMRKTKPWNRLLREVVECPSQELLKTWLGRALDNLT